MSEIKNILNMYKLPELKKMVRATNITGYSKLTKDQLITLMTRPENVDRFKSIKPKTMRQGGIAAFLAGVELSEKSKQAKAKVDRQFKKQVKDTRAKLKFELAEEAKKIEAAMEKKFGKKSAAEKLVDEALSLLKDNKTKLEKIPVMITQDGKRVRDPSGRNFYSNKLEKMTSPAFLQGSEDEVIKRISREIKSINTQVSKMKEKKEAEKARPVAKAVSKKAEKDRKTKEDLNKRILKVEEELKKLKITPKGLSPRDARSLFESRSKMRPVEYKRAVENFEKKLDEFKKKLPK